MRADEGGNNVVDGGASQQQQRQQQQQQQQHNSRRRRQRVAFHVAGFGGLKSGQDDSTTTLIEDLPRELHARRLPRRFAEQNLGGKTAAEEPAGNTIRSEYLVGDGFEVRSCKVLESSVKEGGRQLRELFSKASTEDLTTQKAVFSNETGGGETNNDNCGGGGSGRHDGGLASVFVHCGVNIVATKFALETRGFNEATFAVVDEQGYHPVLTPIEETNSNTNGCMTTTLPVAKVLKNLEGMGWGPDFVSESDDTGGRVFCNHMYYMSLGFCEAKVAGATAATAAAASVDGSVDEDGRPAACNNEQWHSLFIHSPPFSAIPKDKQLAFMADFLSATAASLTGNGTISTDDASKDESLSSGDGFGATTADAKGAEGSPSPLSLDDAAFQDEIEAVQKLSELNIAKDGVPSPHVSFASPSLQEKRTTPPLVSSIWDSGDSPVGLKPPSMPDDGGGFRMDDELPICSKETGMDGTMKREKNKRYFYGSAAAAQSGYDDDDNEDGNDDDSDNDEEQESQDSHQAKDLTRRRLIEAGFDDLDVTAAMETTESDNLEVNMHLLFDITPLLNEGNPITYREIYLRQFCIKGDVAGGDGDSGGGNSSIGSESSIQNKGSSSASRRYKPRTRSAGSASGMGGVSPSWARGGVFSPSLKSLRSGFAGGGASLSPMSTAAADQEKINYNERGVGGGRGGLLSRFRRPRRAASTASVLSEAANDGTRGESQTSTSRPVTVGDFNGSSGDGSGRRRKPPENEYSRNTTGTARSQSPSNFQAPAWRERRGRCREVSNCWSGGATSSSYGGNLKLALLVRLDLGMGQGAIAAECSRAALAAVRKAEESGNRNSLAVWKESGESMVVFGALDVGELEVVLLNAAASHLPITMTREKCASFMSGASSTAACTVAAIGPASMFAIKSVTGVMRIL